MFYGYLTLELFILIIFSKIIEKLSELFLFLGDLD